MLVSALSIVTAQLAAAMEEIKIQKERDQGAGTSAGVCNAVELLWSSCTAVFRTDRVVALIELLS